MSRILGLILAITVASFAVPGRAAPVRDAIPTIEAYRSALEQLDSRAAGASVEATFEAALAIRSALLRADGDETVIERLSEKEFQNLSSTLRGFILNREEIVLAEPEAKFFLALARKHGNAVDLEFFENYSATFPDSVWPSYVEQQTDITGCTLFGAGELVQRYAGWRTFGSKHPDAYARTVAERMSDVERTVAQSTCACGSKEDVLRELHQFAAKFPMSPVANKVRKRIRELRRSESKMRFHCLSG